MEQDTRGVQQQAQEVPVVVEAHAAAQEAAVMVPTQDADTAGRAMPATWWHLALALVTETAAKEPQTVSGPAALSAPDPTQCKPLHPILAKPQVPCRKSRLRLPRLGKGCRSGMASHSEIPRPKAFL